MIKRLLFLLIPLWLSAQVSPFPQTVVTDQQLGVAGNGVQGSLNITQQISDTTITLTNGTCFAFGNTVPCNLAFVPSQFISIDNEIEEICGISTNGSTTTLNLGIFGSNCPSVAGRGLDGSTAAAHNNLLSPVYNNIVAWNNNAKNKEIESIENYLHQGNLRAETYDYSMTNAGSISTGSNTLSIICPQGLYGTDVRQYINIIGGSGGANEGALVTGGSCAFNVFSGTITFTAANSHSGAYLLKSGSCGIYEAVNQGPGNTIHVLSGTCTTYQPIYLVKNFVRISGSGGDGQLGGGSVINNLNGTDGMVVDGSVSGAADGVEIDHLIFTSPTTVTSGYAMKFGGLSFGRIHDNTIEPYSNGVALIGAVEGLRVNTLTAQAIAGDAVHIDVGANGAGRFDDTLLGGNRMGGSNCVNAISAHGIMFNYLYAVGCNDGWKMNPSSTQVSYVDCINCYLDTGPNIGLEINPTASGSVYVIRFTHLTTAAFGGAGVYVGSTGTIGGVHLTDFTSTVNFGPGMTIAGGSDIAVNESQIIGNSNTIAGMYNGIDITGGSHININHSQFGAFDGQLNFQGWGINITGGDYITIADNDLSMNNIGPLQDTSTGAHRFIHDNQGIGIPVLASAGTLNLGTTDARVFRLTGTTNVNSITGGFDQRFATFIKADSGTITMLPGVPLAQNSRVDCVFSTDVPGWFCK